VVFILNQAFLLYVRRLNKAFSRNYLTCQSAIITGNRWYFVFEYFIRQNVILVPHLYAYNPIYYIYRVYILKNRVKDWETDSVLSNLGRPLIVVKITVLGPSNSGFFMTAMMTWNSVEQCPCTLMTIRTRWELIISLFF
jgi:hypothetical protein